MRIIITSFDINIDQNQFIEADESTLAYSVFPNLLTNALKFSKDGETIKIYTEENLDTNEIFLFISDNGIGMNENLCNKIFNPHQVTTRIGLNGETGTGFGLPLVKKFLDLINSKIEVSSKEEKTFPDDHGSTFKISFTKVNPK